MAPEYFKKELRPYEAEAFLKGVEQAQRTSWEQTRMQMYSALAPWSKNLKATDILEFAWDKEKSDAPTREEIESVREWAAQATEMLKMKTNGRKCDSSEITARL
jgi:hypothetical protein